MVTPLRLVVGLGNPGREYARTRHNAGFRFADALAARLGASFGVEAKFAGDVAKAGELRILKPSTYMNLSGRAVAAVARFFAIDPDAILVAHDELDLPPGVARLKFDGGHGGQNGLRDSMRLLGHGKFHRLRIGIGHPGHKDKVTPWVLGRPSLADDALIGRAIDDALAALPLAVHGDFNEAMKRLHTEKRD